MLLSKLVSVIQPEELFDLLELLRDKYLTAVTDFTRPLKDSLYVLVRVYART